MRSMSAASPGLGLQRLEEAAAGTVEWKRSMPPARSIRSCRRGSLLERHELAARLLSVTPLRDPHALAVPVAAGRRSSNATSEATTAVRQRRAARTNRRSRLAHGHRSPRRWGEAGQRRCPPTHARLSHAGDRWRMPTPVDDRTSPRRFDTRRPSSSFEISGSSTATADEVAYCWKIGRFHAGAEKPGDGERRAKFVCSRRPPRRHDRIDLRRRHRPLPLDRTAGLLFETLRPSPATQRTWSASWLPTRARSPP